MIKVCGVLASSANHAEITDGSVSPTLMARAGTGGNQLPLVAYETIRPVAYAVENHPNDSRARIDPNGIVQTLSSRMGTGGNNTPMVLIPVSKNRSEFRCFQNTGQGWWNESDTAATLRTPCGGDSVKANLIVETAEGWES